MTDRTWQIREFDRASASDAHYAALVDLGNSVLKEAMPEDPPSTPEQLKKELQNIPPIVDVTMWVAWDGEKAVGRGDCGVLRMESNQHLAQFDVRVRKEYRGHGLGSELLKRITEVADREGRRMLMANTRSTIAAGEAFMKSIGGEVGMQMHINELDLKDLDRAMMDSWIAKAKERASDFDIETYEGAWKDNMLDEISAMKDLMNTMPTEDLDLEDFHFTPEQVREMDQSMLATGTERWTMIARETATGKMAGYTEMYWNPMKAEIGNQGDTAVFEEFKNRGLGRWLKAAMIQKLLNERPNVKKIRTGNAQSNAPMLKINTDMGFHLAITATTWQVDVDTAKSRLVERVR